MGVIIPVGFSQASMVFSLLGNLQQKVMTLGFEEVSVTPTDAATQATTVYTAFVGTTQPWQAANAFNEWTFQGVTVTKMTSTGPLIGAHLVPIPGTASGESIPTNSAILIKKVTASGGRKNRGRFYQPPWNLATAQCTAAGAIETVSLGILQDRYNQFFTQMTSHDLHPALLHSDATAPTPLTGFSVESIIATQRRRLR